MALLLGIARAAAGTCALLLHLAGDLVTSLAGGRGGGAGREANWYPAGGAAFQEQQDAAGARPEVLLGDAAGVGAPPVAREFPRPGRLLEHAAAVYIALMLSIWCFTTWARHLI